MFGDYNSHKFANLIVTYELCPFDDPNFECKSEQEILEAIAYSYLILLENEQTVKHDEDPGSKEYISSYSHITWYPLARNHNMPLDYPKTIQKSVITYSAHLYSLP